MGKLVSNRYASSLFDAGIELNKIEDFYKELSFIKEIFESEDKLFQIFIHPRIAKDEKKSLIDEVFQDNISKEISNFLYIIIDKRREDNMFGIIDEYKDIFNDYKGIVKVVATTAVPMKDESKERLKEKLENKLNKTIEISNNIDASIIGGVLLNIDDKIIDSTLTSQLQDMENLITDISL